MYKKIFNSPVTSSNNSKLKEMFVSNRFVLKNNLISNQKARAPTEKKIDKT